MQAYRCLLPKSCTGTHWTSSARPCDSPWTVLPTRDVLSGFGVQWFTGGQSHRHPPSVCLTSATQRPIFLPLPKHQQKGVHHKSHYQLNLPGQNDIAWPKISGIQRHCYQAEHSEGSEVIYQETTKRQTEDRPYAK